MAKVLEESITMGGLGDWQDTSSNLGLFDPLAKPQYIPTAQYIPTVGAIFTVPVNFHITQPEIPGEKPQEGQPKDLWEKHAASIRPASAGLGGIQVEQRVLDQARMSAREDAHKTSLLRKAIVETLAKYGYRMEHVKGYERILVVIEAPKPMSSQAPALARRDIVATGGLRGLYGRHAALESGLGWSVGRAYAKDRCLLSVKKADVTTAATYDKIESKVREVRY
jgi:hypothetical protein